MGHQSFERVFNPNTNEFGHMRVNVGAAQYPGSAPSRNS